MHVHILGIAGKLMAGLALMAHELGYRVSGSDANLQSPMAKQLKSLNIKLYEGYESDNLADRPDLVIVGNVMSRGMPIVEAVMNRKIEYISAPEWLARFVLKDKWVIAVSGTHGKTTTTSMIAWILEYAGFSPSFLIGGQPNNFDSSSRLNQKSPFFVIEADEYDSAFFDKRPKFIHYHPNTLLINNIEYDHADIYDSLAAIQKQFHYLVRTVPGEGLIIAPKQDHAVNEVFERGVWTPVQTFGVEGDWTFSENSGDFREFSVRLRGEKIGVVRWGLLGDHNALNALSAIAAAHHAGIKPSLCIEALCKFTGVERRMQPVGELHGAKVYDDFAHHPTAIKTTLQGVRNNLGPDQRIVVILEFGSFTMKHGVHQTEFAQSLRDADYVFFLSQNCNWNVKALTDTLDVGHQVHSQLDALAPAVADQIKAGDTVIIMSNQDSMKISKAIGL